MLCDLCGETPFPVESRTFTWAGQTRTLEVCSTCADRANEALARREARWAVVSPLHVDVKGYEVTPGQEARDRAAARARRAARGGKRLHVSRALRDGK